MEKLYVGTAGWGVPQKLRSGFPEGESLLHRYSKIFSCVEINSSFYREHKADTYAKWAVSVPEHFRFSVKLSKYFTQEARLEEAGAKLKYVLAGIRELGEKLGVILVQLPPKLEFNDKIANAFFTEFRQIYDGKIALEPRHVSWASEDALKLMHKFRLAKVRADPERCYVKSLKRDRVEPFLYYRLHGSPVIYRSRYEPELIENLSKKLLSANVKGKEAWCVFDNTAMQFATENGIELLDKYKRAASSQMSNQI